MDTLGYAILQLCRTAKSWLADTRTIMFGKWRGCLSQNVYAGRRRRSKPNRSEKIEQISIYFPDRSGKGAAGNMARNRRKENYDF